MNLYEELCSITGAKHVLQNEPMSGHTTFRIGGPADFFVMPSDTEEIRQIAALCRRESVPYYVVGNGSNLLVGDRGYRGVIVQVFKNMNHISVDNGKICAQAGALLSKVAAAAYEAGPSRPGVAPGLPGDPRGAGPLESGG